MKILLYIWNLIFKKYIYIFFFYYQISNIYIYSINNNYQFNSLIKEIYKPIVFDVYIDDLSKYGYNRFIAGCTDINLIALRFSNDTKTPPYTYTQALVKQLNLNKNIEFKEKDFTLLVNVNTTYTDKLNITYQVDLEHSILHELLHGLGFGSETGHIKELDSTNKNKTIHDYVYAPREMHEINEKLLLNVEGHSDYFYLWGSSEYKGLYPLSIYEKHFVDLHTKKYIFKGLEFLYQELDCFNKTLLINVSDDFATCVNKLSSKTRDIITTIPMKYYLKAHSIGFLNKLGKIIPLQTFDNAYREGGSICHIEFTKEKEFNKYLNETIKGNNQNSPNLNNDNIYNYIDENMLMYYCEVGADHDLILSTVAKNNKHELISSDILSVLTTLGWTEKGTTKSNNTYYVADDIIIPELNSFPMNRKYYDYGDSDESYINSNGSKMLNSLQKITLFMVICNLYFLLQ